MSSCEVDPRAINRLRRGGPIPFGAPVSGPQGALGGLGGREVVERRTERSRTSVTPDGHFETAFYGVPVNYRDAQGAWQPIDNTLVAGAAPDYGLRNAANRISVSLPATLDKAPVLVKADGRWLAFSLHGAGGGAVTEGPRATYADALRGVSVAYTALNQGLKEELVLAGPTAPGAYDFDVALSPGLSAQQTAAGGVALSDSSGATWATVAAPSVHDAARPGSPPAQGPVSLKVVGTAPHLGLHLAVDGSWLADPARSWPVSIDPTVTFASGYDTSLLSDYPSSNFGATTDLSMVGGSVVRRILYRPDSDITAFFTEPVDVLGATVSLYANTDTTGTPAQAVGVHEVSADWSDTAATWNQRLSGVSWASPGGDFVSQPAAVNNNIAGPAGYRSWWITALAQSWAYGEKPQRGLLFKYENEASGTYQSFDSFNKPNSSTFPQLSVQWDPLQSVRQPYRYETFALGERRAARVNVASGNLTVQERDLDIAGTGPAATVERDYDSRGPYIASIGARWRMWPQSKERLRFTSGGDVFWQGGPNLFLEFTKNADGTYNTPAGYRATLTYDGSYHLNMHNDGTVYSFYAGGWPLDITDRNGNKITFYYSFDAANNDYDLVQMVDTQGRATNFERIGPNQVTKVTDPAGRLYQYGYGTDASGNTVLTSYTDPAGKVTRYEYQAGGYLTKITDPNGNMTTFAYTRVAFVSGTSGAFDNSLQLTSLTRVSDPLSGAGPTWRFDYSTPWQTRLTDPNGHLTTYTFDRRGRVTQVS
ncbi:MAG: DNRLRE domain-containing protein, partial [Actinobacteria bacterium]|nr:DNRLRE domain-containing protein [Actinomycetota bacterium]